MILKILFCELHFSCKQALALQGTFGFIERIFKDPPCLTLLPLKSAGVLPISVAGNLNLWQALSKSTIHLNIFDNLTNIQLQHCDTSAKYTNHSRGREEGTWVKYPTSLQFGYRPKNCTQQERASHSVILSTEFFMSWFHFSSNDL